MTSGFPDVEFVIRDPLRVIYENFRFSATPSEISEKFSAYFSGGNYYQIPSLNHYHASNLPCGSLVRFQCMVQDNTFQLEHYKKVLLLEKTSRTFCSEFAITGLFCDSFQKLENEGFKFEDFTFNSLQDLGTRQLAFCISPPCESDWMKAKHLNESTFIFPRTIEAGGQNTLLKKYPSQKFEDRISAMVKFYTHKDEVDINDLIEIVGIMEYNKDNKQTYVHCLLMKHLHLKSETQVQSRVDSHVQSQVDSHVQLEMTNLPVDLPANMSPESARDLIIEKLSAFTFFDKLSAEYLFLSLISGVSARTSDGVAIDNFPINFCNASSGKIPEYWPVSLYEFVSCLSPYNKYLELSLNALNKEPLSPEMTTEDCEELGSLNSGALQLLNSTCVIVDEMKLTEGKLESLGIENFNTLKSSIRDSVLEYKVPYCSVVKPINLKFIVVSSAPSILGLDIIVPVMANSQVNTMGSDFVAHMNSDFVAYIQSFVLAPVCKCNISPELQDQISLDYVSMRETQKNEKPSSTDLSSMLNVARLISKSLLEPQVSKEAWNLAKNLEAERRSRLSAMRKALAANTVHK